MKGQGHSGKKVAVVLSGCGNKDGAEITEAVAAIVSLSEYRSEVDYFAPEVEFHPKNYLTDQFLTEKRSTLLESARITRSKIKPLNSLDPSMFDALVIPGGFGVALHLSDWAQKGPQASIDPDFQKVILNFHSQGKPICAICIAPAIVAKVLGQHHVTVTFGLNRSFLEWGPAIGARVELCPSDDFVSDRQNKLVTTPAYMNDEVTPFEVFTGIRKAIRETLEMA